MFFPRSPEYLVRNPLGGVPILGLDDGAILSESVEIWYQEVSSRPSAKA